MDEQYLEMAAELEAFLRENGIAAARRKGEQSCTPPPEFVGECLDCGGEIPVERRDNGYYRCVACVHEEEHRKKLGL